MQALPQAEALIGSSYRIDAPLLDRAPKLQVISSISVGVDNYDLAALRARGIMLCHTPGVLTETTADTIFALVMATSRRLVELALHVRDGHWTRNIDESLFGWDVHGKTLGIVGFGRIGQAVARRAALGFGMPVLYHARSPVAPAPELAGRAQQVPLDELLASADIVVADAAADRTDARPVRCRPLRGDEAGCDLRQRLARRRSSTRLRCSPRSTRGHLRAAGLDVFAIEPLPPDSPLRTHPRVTALPHIGSATHETRHAMAALAVSNLLQALDGVRPQTVVS